MDKSLEMKKKVLGMLEDFMMGEQGRKIKPKAIEVEMIAEGPGAKKQLKDILDEASDEAPDMDSDAEEEREFESSTVDKAMDSANAKKAGMSVEDWEDSEGDEAADEAEMGDKKKSRSLKEFFARK